MLLSDPPTPTVEILWNNVYIGTGNRRGKVLGVNSKMGPMVFFPTPLSPNMITIFNMPNIIPKGIEFAKKDQSFGESILAK
jgi:hypothetical protein